MIKIVAVGEPKANGPNLSELLKLVAESPTPDRVATKVAKLLNVQRTEVAFLRLENTLLNFFIHPNCARLALFRFLATPSQHAQQPRALPCFQITFGGSSTLTCSKR